MVNVRLCDMARQAFLSASPRRFSLLDCETETPKCKHETFRLLSSNPRSRLRARMTRMSLYNLLASFFELAGTGNSILTHHTIISR